MEKQNDLFEKYKNMQHSQYEYEASLWFPHTSSTREAVVGSFDLHNEWADYEWLWKDVTESEKKTVLDFGCGPGRNLVKFSDKFLRIDGVDISGTNLVKAKDWIEYNNLNPDNFTLYKNDGENLQNVPDDTYDIVMSTIAMQHICVHSIRFNLLSEFYRVLKSGGMITIQMGYGHGHPNSVAYHENYFNASSTNGGMDTRVEDQNFLKEDLEKIGFKDFKFYLRPTGPGDLHEKWIFFNAKK
jgi:ubiquinone/menaquinone biosynthesis C-methylase UbiE